MAQFSDRHNRTAKEHRKRYATDTDSLRSHSTERKAAHDKTKDTFPKNDFDDDFDFDIEER